MGGERGKGEGGLYYSDNEGGPDSGSDDRAFISEISRVSVDECEFPSE